jgi:hypothetical protein
VVPPEPRFSIVQVGPDFSPRDYANTFAALQLPPSGKVLDLVPARLLCADIFERLAAAWTAAPAAVSRLGIVLSFERVGHATRRRARLPAATRGAWPPA